MSNYGSLDAQILEMYVLYFQRYNTLLFRSRQWRPCMFISIELLTAFQSNI